MVRGIRRIDQTHESPSTKGEVGRDGRRERRETDLQATQMGTRKMRMRVARKPVDVGGAMKDVEGVMVEVLVLDSFCWRILGDAVDEDDEVETKEWIRDQESLT